MYVGGGGGGGGLPNSMLYAHSQLLMVSIN